MECVYCRGMLDPSTLRCRNCGRDQPTVPSTAPIPALSGALTRRCPTCGDVLPAQARFCGRCGQPSGPLPQPETAQHSGHLIEPWIDAAAEQIANQSPVPGAPAAPQSGALSVPNAPPGPQTGAPGVPGALAGPQGGASGVPYVPPGPQSGAPGVPGVPAGPQSGAPGVPGAPAGSQSGAPSVPSASASPQGAQPIGRASTALRAVGRGATRSLGGKLLGTTAAKIIVAVLAVVVVGVSVTGAYLIFQPKPQPVLQVSSLYHVGALPAGAVGTSFSLTGRDFSANTQVTFLLDGKPAPGNPAKSSDEHGNIQVFLSVTAGWAIGRHILTARDAKGYSTKYGSPVVIVAQGTAHTPGPNGAPADDASFKIGTTFMSNDPTYVSLYGSVFSGADLIITGHSDPTGGTVCGQYDGQSRTMPDPDLNVTEIETLKCDSGSYKDGKLTYKGTAYLEYQFSDGSTCMQIFSTYSMEGTFITSSYIKGTYIQDDPSQPDCNGPNISFTVIPFHQENTWSGVILYG